MHVVNKCRFAILLIVKVWKSKTYESIGCHSGSPVFKRSECRKSKQIYDTWSPFISSRGIQHSAYFLPIWTVVRAVCEEIHYLFIHCVHCMSFCIACQDLISLCPSTKPIKMRCGSLRFSTSRINRTSFLDVGTMLQRKHIPSIPSYVPPEEECSPSVTFPCLSAAKWAWDHPRTVPQL